VNGIDVTTPQIVAQLADIIEVTAAPETGWKVKTITASGGSSQMAVTLSNGLGITGEFGPRTGTFNLGTYTYGTNISVTVEFERITHTITPSITASEGSFTYTVNGGSLQTGPVINAKLDDTVVITAMPAKGWKVSAITASGMFVSDLTSGIYDSGRDEHFGPRTGTFTMGAFLYNDTITISIEFEKFYHVLDVPVTSDEGTIITKVDGNSIVAPNEVRAELGDPVEIVANPRPGYRIDNLYIIIDPVTAGEMTNVTLRPVGGDSNEWIGSFDMGAFEYGTSIKIEVDYGRTPHSFTPTVIGEGLYTFTVNGGDPKPAGLIIASVEDVVAIIAEPDDGWRVGSITVSPTMTVNMTGGTLNNSIYYGERTGTFTMGAFPTGTPIVVTITYIKIDHRININNPGSGSVDVKVKVNDSFIQQTTAQLGDDVIITAAPYSGWRVKNITVTGGMENEQLGANNFGVRTLTFTMGAFPFISDGQISVNIEYEHIYDIIVNVPAPGTIAGSFVFDEPFDPLIEVLNEVINDQANVRVPAGKEVKITVTPNTGWKVQSAGWRVTGGNLTNLFTTGTGNDDASKPVNFTLDPFGYSFNDTITVEVQFEKLTHIIRTVSNDSTAGTVTVTPSENAQVADTRTITADPAPGWRVQSIFIKENGNTTTNGGLYTFTAGDQDIIRSIPYTMEAFKSKTGDITTDISADVVFEKLVHTITVSVAPPGAGSVTVNSGVSTSVNVGDPVEITATPAPGWRVQNIKLIDSENGNSSLAQLLTNSTQEDDSLKNYNYTMGGFRASIMPVVLAEFVEISHEIEPVVTNTNVPAAGTAKVNGEDSIDNAKVGDPILITATPALGWKVQKIEYIIDTNRTDLSLKNAPEGLDDSYEHGTGYGTFLMPGLRSTESISVEVTFVELIFNVTSDITPSADNPGNVILQAGGIGTVNNVDAKIGDTVSITATPNPGWKVTSITWQIGTNTPTILFTLEGDGDNDPISRGFTMGGYVFGTEIQVNVVFDKITYTITKGSETNGTFTIDGTRQIGNTITVTTTPDTGYRVKTNGVTVIRTDSVTPPIVTLEDNGTYTFEMPPSDITVNVEFEKITYIITDGVKENGNTFTVTGLAQIGETITVETTPATGYRVKENGVTVDGFTPSPAVELEDENEYTFEMPPSDITVNVEFEKITYNITEGSKENGNGFTVSGLAQIGETITVTATPNAGSGYRVISMSYTPDGGSAVNIPSTGNVHTFTMIASDIVVDVEFSNVYDIIRNTPTLGAIIDLKENAEYGETVYFTVTRNSGANRIDSVTVDGDIKTSDDEGGYSFEMPDSDVIVMVTITAPTAPNQANNITLNTPTGEGTGRYTVRVGNHTVTAPTQAGASRNETVTITVYPGDGFIADVTSTPNASTQSPGNENVYTFTMPNAAATISVSFEETASPSSASLSIRTPAGNVPAAVTTVPTVIATTPYRSYRSAPVQSQTELLPHSQRLNPENRISDNTASTQIRTINPQVTGAGVITQPAVTPTQDLAPVSISGQSAPSDGRFTDNTTAGITSEFIISDDNHMKIMEDSSFVKNDRFDTKRDNVIINFFKFFFRSLSKFFQGRFFFKLH
jgi:hypothetical protein